jgi:hypothetical protein
MEGLSCGLPVVASRVGGIPGIVEHDTTGLLVDQGDIDGLACALIALLRDPSRCIRMGKAAQRFAGVHLDIQRTADRLVDLYHETIAARSAGYEAQTADTDDISVAERITDHLTNCGYCNTDQSTVAFDDQFGWICDQCLRQAKDRQRGQEHKVDVDA